VEEKSYGQLCILFNHFLFRRDLFLADNHGVLRGAVLDLSEHLLNNM
jgi:hypothetical protein